MRRSLPLRSKVCLGAAAALGVLTVGMPSYWFGGGFVLALLVGLYDV